MTTSIKKINQTEIITDRLNHHIKCLSRNIDQCIQQIEIDENLKTIQSQLLTYRDLIKVIIQEIDQSPINNIRLRIENAINSILGTNHKIDLSNLKAIDELKLKEIVPNELIKSNIMSKTLGKTTNKIAWYKIIMDIYKSSIITDGNIFPSSITHKNFQSFLNQLAKSPSMR